MFKWSRFIVSVIASSGLSLLVTAQAQTLLYADASNDPLLQNAPALKKIGPIELFGFQFESPEMVMLFVVGLILFTWFFMAMMNQYD